MKRSNVTDSSKEKSTTTFQSLTDLVAARDVLAEPVRRQITDLLAVNDRLEQEIAERRRVEESLRQTQQELEQRVTEQPAALRHERNLMAAMLDTAGALVVVLNQQGQIVRFNQACEQTTGYTVAEVKGRYVWDLFLSPEEQTPVKAIFDHLHAGEFPNQFENHWLSRSGQRRLIAWSNTALLNRNGLVEYVIGVGIDITDQRQTEEALKESEELHRITLSQITDAVFITNDQGTFTYICPNAHHIFGYVAAEIQEFGNIGRLLGRELFDPDQLDAVKEIRNIEREITDKFGQTHGLLVNVKRVSIKGGTLLYTCRDVSERKVMEEALRQRELFSRSVMNSLDTHIAVLDKEGTITAVNEAWEAFARENGDAKLAHTGISSNYLAVCRRATVEDVSDAQAVSAGIQSVLGGSKTRFSYEYICETPTAKRWFLLRATPLQNQAGGAVVAHTDITRLKQALIQINQLNEILTEERTLLRTLIDNMPDYIYVKDTRSRFITGNWALADLMGAKTLKNLIGKTDFDFYPEELAKEFYADEREIIRSGRPLIDKEERTINSAGQDIWNSTTKVPLKNNDGQIIGIVGISRNITERKKAEVALKESEARAKEAESQLLDAIESLTEAFALYDADDHLVLCNSKYREFYDLSGDLLVPGVRFEDYIRISAYRGQVADALGREEAWIQERIEQHQNPAGVYLQHLSNGRWLQINERKTSDGGIVGVRTDITALKQAEEEKAHLFEEISRQRQQLRGLNRRLAEVQEAERKVLAQELHDQVGQNLTALDLNLNIIQGQLSGGLPAKLEVIQTRLDDSLLLVEETGRRIRDVMANLRPPMLDDYGLLAALRWYAHQFAERVNFTITVKGKELSSRPPASIEDTLFRITQEALTNVAKHAQASHVEIRVDNDEDFINFVISDNGRGFDLAQLADSTQRTSWGLITLVERVEAVGGYCQVESLPNQGTKIIVQMFW